MSSPRRSGLWGAALVALVVMAGGAWWVAARTQSPREAVARASEPKASWITAPVEFRVLSKSLVQRGDVRPEVSLSVGVPASVEGTAIVTAVVVKVGDTVPEGARVVEVSGRPVFVLQGDVPVFRTLRPGMSGADVTQLQQALLRLGYLPDTDGTFGEATKSAVAAWYGDAGYVPVPASLTSEADVAAAQLAFEQADTALTAARTALATAKQGQSASTVAQAQATVNSAQRALDQAKAAQITDVANAQADLNAANAEVTRLTADPATLPADLDTAKVAVVKAQSAVTTVNQSAQVAVDNAADALFVAQLSLQEAKKGTDVSQAQSAVEDATAARDTAYRVWLTVVATAGSTVAQGEVVFVPRLPARVQSVVSSLGAVDSGGAADGSGAASSGGLATLSGGTLVVSTSVRSSDIGLIRVGMDVELLDEITNTTYAGTVESVADQPVVAPDGTLGFPAVISSADVLPDALVGANVRVTITAASTDTETLVVPLAAVSSRADGSTRVSVLRDPAGDPEDVDVIVGISADGFAAIEPATEDSLKAGDKVVVGR